MKGIVFNLLEKVVVEHYGENTWEDLLDAAGVDGSYTSLGSYPDEDLLKLVGAASSALNLAPDAIVRWFGQHALGLLAQTYPQLFTAHTSTRPFLLTLNDIIHPEVRKLYPGADVPEFDYDTSDPQVLRMGYRSARRLCALGEGLIAGAADHYGEDFTLAQTSCVHRGDDRCVYEVSFRPRAGQASA
jgi:hypothetical protein